ncbi:alginate export family protein [Sphingomonas sp. IC-56]|uniref:alginate export family protein n=1 Tax=Sphingomonas sp. IC-56 TaxID=2898529 RepID=UPI002ED9C9D9
MPEPPPLVQVEGVREQAPRRQTASAQQSGGATPSGTAGGDTRRSLPEGGPSSASDAQLSGPSTSANQRDVTTIYDKGGLTVHWSFQGGLNLVSEEDLFWNFASVYAPTAGFNSDETWLEAYAKPGVSFDQRFESGRVLYGRLSGVASRTFGTDAFDARDEGAVTLDEGYLGLRTTDRPANYDFSAGPRELKLGTGMLIANGGVSGFERGALKFGPRKAWEQAVIGRMTTGEATFTGYFVQPRELRSNDGDNQLAGFDMRYDAKSGDYLGFTYINVLRSHSPYARAAAGGLGPPTIIPDGRDKTNVVNLYFRASASEGPLRNLFATGDLAYEWNNPVDLSAWGARAQIGYLISETGWRPSLTSTFKIFSGDDPTTARLERFDPLYYEGSPGAWATGSKSSMVFINSNLQAMELALAVQPSRKDAFTLRYAHIRADKLASPIQFGQATRLISTPSGFNLIAGVTKHHLSDDLFLEYNHIFSQHVFLTAGVSASFPGAGIKASFPGKAPTWTGAFVNVVVNY